MSTEAPSIVPVGTVVQSTREEAQQRLAAIRNALGRADALLVEAWRARDWKALKHSTWKAYVAKELPDYLMLQVRGDDRDRRIRELAAAGLTMGPIADALGVGKGTVHRALGGVELDDTATDAVGRTMARRATRSPARKRGPRKTDRVVLMLIAAGAGGMDVKDVRRELRCERHEASATLTRLVDAKRIVYRAPERRGQFGRYFAPSIVPTGTV